MFSFRLYSLLVSHFQSLCFCSLSLVKELGKKLFLDSGTLTPVLKSLEAKGYVIRSRSKEDERVLEVEITEKGEKLKEDAVSVPESVAGCVKLDSEEAMQLYTLLYKVLGSLRDE